MEGKRARLLRYLLVTCALAWSAVAIAQDAPIMERDTVIIESEDTVLMRSYAARFDPAKALLYAAAVPGLGQVYNKKYWKLPLLYGGAFLVARQIHRNNDFYKYYRSLIFENIAAGQTDPNDMTSIKVQLQVVRRQANRARRERDYFVIIMGLVYVLQIVDAHVDAHLKEFELNPNLKVAFRPTLESDAIMGRQTGLSLTMKF